MRRKLAALEGVSFFVQRLKGSGVIDQSYLIPKKTKPKSCPFRRYDYILICDMLQPSNFPQPARRSVLINKISHSVNRCRNPIHTPPPSRYIALSPDRSRPKNRPPYFESGRPTLPAAPSYDNNSKTSQARAPSNWGASEHCIIALHISHRHRDTKTRRERGCQEHHRRAVAPQRRH